MMRRLVFAFVLSATLGGLAAAQRPAPAVGGDSLLTVDRIYASPEFRGGSFGPLAWLGDGSAYTTLERSTETREGRDIVRYDAATESRACRGPRSRRCQGGPIIVA